MKRTIAALLSIFLALSVFSLPAFAAEKAGTNNLICPKCGSSLNVNAVESGVYLNYSYVCSNSDCDYKREEQQYLWGDTVKGSSLTPVQDSSNLPGYANTTNGTPSIDADGAPSTSYSMNSGGYDSPFGYSLPFNVKWQVTLNKYNTNDHYYNQLTNGNTTFSNGKLFCSSILTDNSTTAPVADVYYYFTPTFSGYYTFSIPDYTILTFSKNGQNEYNSTGGKYSTSILFKTSSLNPPVYERYSETNLFSKSSQTLSNQTFSVSDYTCYLKKGQTAFIRFYTTMSESLSSSTPYKAFSIQTGTPTILAKDMESAVGINKQANITINNNVWNGNIYVDNSTNLTYIYPQYTTINENNETVTNISNNPIIYNNTTNEYYTYDSVTNNYYYITYVTETPTPTPEPDPTPSSSPSPAPDPTPTPDPGTDPTPTPTPGTDPTPTPTPGGNTGDTTGIIAILTEIKDNMIQGFADIKAALVQGWADLSANFTLAIDNLSINIKNYFDKKLPDQSTPETAEPSPSPSPSPTPTPSPSPSSTPTPTETPTPTQSPGSKPSGDTNNFWNFVFPGSDDGTDNGHKGILWALISLLIAVVTFVLGLGSAYTYVFPFLPSGLVTTIHICVLVLLLFAIIKFVRSFL